MVLTAGDELPMMACPERGYVDGPTWYTGGQRPAPERDIPKLGSLARHLPAHSGAWALLLRWLSVGLVQVQPFLEHLQ